MPLSFNPLLGVGLDKSIPLDGAGKIPSTYLPSYVDDVEEYNNLAAFPATGETGKIYVAIDTGFVYRWSGSVYVQIGVTSPGGSTTQVQFNNAGAFGGSADLTWDDTGKVLGVGGDIDLDDGGTYTTTLQTITPTAARTISFPDATGTIGLVGGSSGNLVANQSGAYAGVANSSVDNATGNITLGSRFISSLNGAASAPPGTFTGTWFTGGTATTTKPQVLIEPTGTTSTGWSTSGTGIGVNAASGFTGRLLDLQLNGTSNFNIDSTGRVSFPLATAALPAFYPGTDTNTGMWSPAADTLAWSTNGVERTRIDSSGRLLVGTSSASILRYGSNTAKIETNSVDFHLAMRSDLNANGSPFATFVKTRASAIVQSGDAIGAFEWRAHDGTDVESVAASIGAFVDGTPGADDMPGRLVFYTTADGASSPTERLRITSDAYVRLASGTGGIQFNGDTAAANALDDYEEGTFTPTVAGNSTDGTATYGTQFGAYTKIGRQVHVVIYLDWSAGTGTGSLQVKGLPFNVANTANFFFPVSLGNVSNIALTASNYLLGYAYQGFSTIVFAQSPVGGGASGGVTYDAAGTLMLSCCYYV